MKIFFTITLLLYSSVSSADLKWIRGPFWKTAYENNFTLQMINSNDEIKDECSFFESSTLDENGSPTSIDAADFKAIDAMALPSDMTNLSFQVDFKLSIPATLAVSIDLQNRTDIANFIKAESMLDVLPSYTQMPSEIRLTPQTFQNAPTLQKNAKSLSALASRLFVNLKTPKFIRLGSDVFLRVNSKAVACDLLSGQATLKLNAQAQVKIILDAQIHLQNTYSELETAALAVMAKSKSPRVRAALFGFRMSEILDQDKSLQTAQIENRMLMLLDQLFEIDTMNPSSVWQDGINQKTLSVSGTSSPFDAQVEIRGIN